MNYTTTKELELQLGIKQRAITNRIHALGIKPKLAGRVILLTAHQAKLVSEYPELRGRPKKNGTLVEKG